MKGCSDTVMKMTGGLHIVALAVAIYGTFKQIESIKAGKPFSSSLAIALTIMLLLRVPNQVCVAMQQSHGWFSVFGTLMGAAGFGYLTYISMEQEKVQRHHPMA